MINQDSKSAVQAKFRPEFKARQHALRPCEPERKVANMFSEKTSYEMFIEGEQRANLTKPAETKFLMDSKNKSFLKLCMQSLVVKL